MRARDYTAVHLGAFGLVHCMLYLGYDEMRNSKSTSMYSAWVSTVRTILMALERPVSRT